MDKLLSKNRDKKQNRAALIALLKKKKQNPRVFKFPISSGKIEQRKGTIVDYILHRQSDAPHKFFVVDIFRLSWKKRTELRFGYYILGKKPTVSGKWVWGQYAPFIPIQDLKVIIKKLQGRNIL